MNATETRAGHIIENIIAAVDLSSHSEATARYAAQIAERFGARLTLVHVYSPNGAAEFLTEEGAEAFAKQRRLAEQNLAALAESIRTGRKPCETVFLVGEPAEQVSRLARALHADLIITAGHHPSFLGRLFGLDRASRTLCRAPCPVWVYHGKQR